MLFSKFLIARDADPNDGAGGGDTPPNPGAVVEDKVAIPIEQLKEWGFESLEQMAGHFASQKQPAPTPEEIERQQQLRNANFIKFAVEENLLKTDDIQKFKEISAKPDQDLVFADFVSQWVEENPDADVQEDAAIIRQAFETQYHLNSENPVLKKRGEKLLAKEAELLRSPIVEQYKTAESRFNDYETVRGIAPKYNEFIDEQIKKIAPDKLVVFKKKIGDSEVDVDFELTQDDRDEIARLFKNPKTFAAFKDGKTDELVQSLTKKVSGYIKQKHETQILENVWNKAQEVGKTQAPYVGAKAPFPIVPTGLKTSGNSGGDYIQQILKSHANVPNN